MLLLGVALTVGQFLERNNINWMSEAGGALIVGIVLGLLVTLANNVSQSYSELFKFQVRPHRAPVGVHWQGRPWHALRLRVHVITLQHHKPRGACRRSTSSCFCCRPSYLTRASTSTSNRAPPSQPLLRSQLR